MSMKESSQWLVLKGIMHDGVCVNQGAGTVSSVNIWTYDWWTSVRSRSNSVNTYPETGHAADLKECHTG